MATIGQRGKYAEGKVLAWLRKESDARAALAYIRFPDARAGSLQTAPADFGVTYKGCPYKLEVKELTVPADRKSRIIPEKNFAADKRSRMAKWQLAGESCWVIVCHLPMREWRLVPLDVFTGPRVPSWDVSPYPAYRKLDLLMAELFGEK